MGNQYSEDLFRSIDTIVSARMSNLPYDQTMIAYISDTSQSAEGIYKAKYESLEVTAYSENTEYKLGDQVYISVPRADYKQKKIILGRIPQDKQEVVKVRPFENFVSCTENFNKTNREISIIANNTKGSTPLPQYRNCKQICAYSFILNKNYRTNAGFDSIGLKANIAASVENSNYIATSGDYGILVVAKGYNQTKTKDEAAIAITGNAIETLYFKLSLTDMVNINHYNTYGYCGQEAVFNISGYVLRELSAYLVQFDDFKTSDGTHIPEDQKLQIFCKDIELTLGYNGRPINFENGKLFIYTPDGLLYNSNETLVKQLFSRVIINKDGVIYNYTPPNSYEYIKWFKYDSSVGEYSSILNTTSYTELEEVVSYSPAFDFNKSSSTTQTQKYRMAISKDRNIWLASDPITFTNNVNLTNSEILDSINGFQVISLEDNEGIFNLYGQDSLLLNDAESFKTHHLRLSYSATASDRKLRPGDIIKWKIPKDKTMLLPALTKYGEPIEEIILTAADLDDENTYLLPFKIKNLYNPTYTQNTISCELTLVEEDGINTVLTYNKELLFGTSGSSGNDYILVLELCRSNIQNEKVSAVLNTETADHCKNNYTIVPKLYSYTMEEIDLKSTSDLKITYSWLNTDITINYSNTENGWVVDFNGIDSIPPGARIIKGEISKLGVTAYLPIATKYGVEYEYAEGCKTIIYDITGKKPIYQKFENKIQPEINFDKKLFSLQLQYFNQDGTSVSTNTISGLPVLNGNIIVPPSVYSSQINNIYLEYLYDNSTAWIQPILITKNKYPSAMLNAEMNPTQIGRWLVEQNMVGQIEGNSGLLLGQLSENGKDRFGLVALKDNVEFFRLLTDTGELHIENGTGLIDVSNQSYKLVSAKDTGFNIGSANKPVYFKNGIPVQCDYELIAASTITNLNNTISNLSKQITSLTDKVNKLETQLNALKEQIL